MHKQTKVQGESLIIVAFLCATFSAFAQTATNNPTAAQAQTNTPAATHQLSPAAQLEVFHPPHPRWFENLSTQAHLFGDWWGLRTNLIAHGLNPSLVWVSDTLGNPFGGVNQGIDSFNNIGADLYLDLNRLAGIQDGVAYVSGSERFGNSLSAEHIHNTFNVAQVCCGSTYRLVDVYYQQDNQFDVRLGRIAAGDEFLSSTLYGFFVQNGIDGNPVGIFFNAPGMTAYPNATWGLRLRTRPNSPFYAMAGVFNGNETLSENRNHGVNVAMNGPLFAIAEVGYRLNQGTYDPGKPGNYRVGVWYDDHEYQDFLGGPDSRTRGNTGFYVLLDQMVYRQGGPKSKQGLFPFVSLLFSPDTDISTMPFFANGGLVYTGIIPGRPDDAAAFGVIYGAFSDRLAQSQTLAGLAAQNHETVFEWNYRIKVRPWFYVQPDFQYILRPGGTGKIRDALVVGAQIALSF